MALLGDSAPDAQVLRVRVGLEDAVCLSAEMEALSGDVERVLLAYNPSGRLCTARVQLHGERAAGTAGRRGGADDGTGRSQPLRRYQRLTKEAEALIASGDLPFGDTALEQHRAQAWLIAERRR